MHELRGIDIHVYAIKDASRAIAFWRDTMGLRPAWIDEAHGAEFELGDGSTFGIWKLEDEGGSWSKGTGVMFAVDDLLAAIEHFRAKGVTISDADETPVCHMAFAQDSEGNEFILHQRK
jgi:predicted enzyme related to lactoylglutathione lyase